MGWCKVHSACTHGHGTRRGEKAVDCCGAWWIVFHPDDSDKLRQYLRKKQGRTDDAKDPIHAQETFVTEQMLRELEVEEGVYAFQFHQGPNQAVFIPAGAAHQVMYKLYS